MATTPRGYRYPAPDAAPDVAADIHNLALDVDADYTEVSPRPAPSRPGRRHRNLTTGELSLDIGTAWVTTGWVGSSRPSYSDAPIGSGKLWFAPAPPTDWYLTDGAYITRAAPNDLLYAAIGTQFNLSGDSDATRFRLPDLRGLTPAMVDGSAGRISGADALGNVMGEQRHLPTLAETAPHRHIIRAQSGIGGGIPVDSTAPAGGRVSTGGADPIPAGGSDGELRTESAGIGDPFNVMQPTFFLLIIIRFR